MERKTPKSKSPLYRYLLHRFSTIDIFFFQRDFKTLTKTHSFKTACFIQTGRRILKLVVKLVSN